MGAELTNYFFALDEASGTGLGLNFPQCTVTPPDTVYSGFRLLFPKSDGWHQKDSAGLDSGLVSIPTPGGTANRVAYFSGAYALTNSANLTFDGTTLTMPPASLVSMGGGSGTARVKGTADVDTTAGATDDTLTSEQTLYSYTVPANSFNANGRHVHMHITGSVSTRGSVDKTIRVKWGADTLFTFAVSDTTAGNWRLDVWIYRTGSGTYDWDALWISETSGSQGKSIQQGNGSETDTSAIVLAVTGQLSTADASGNDDIIVEHVATQFNN